MTLSYITDAVEKLTDEVQMFKTVQEKKLQELERKSVSQDHTQVESMMERVSKLEAISQRPARGLDGETHEEKSRFMTYVRKGGESLSLEQKSLSSITPEEGGYLVPQIVSDTMVKTITAYSPIRELARTTAISSDALEVLLDKTEADIGWAAQSGDRPETKTPELARMKISVHEMYARPRATQTLLDDASIDVEKWLVEKVSDKMARVENASFINGDGQGKPRGFLTHETTDANEWGKLQAFKTGANGAFYEGMFDPLLNALHAMKPEYLSEAVWIMPRSAKVALLKLKTEDGRHIYIESLEAKLPDTLLGYPVVLCDDMPTLKAEKASKSIVFANLKEAYQIVDRQGMHVMRDPYSAKPYVEFYTTRRVGGDVVNFDAIKVIDFAE